MRLSLFTTLVSILALSTAQLTVVGNSSSLATKEVRRYFYVATGHLPSLFEAITEPWELMTSPSCEAVMLHSPDEPVHEMWNSVLATTLAPQARNGSHTLTTTTWKGCRIHVLRGIDQDATLYAAYTFAEQLGVRFYIHGDTLPTRNPQLQIPDLHINASPEFDIRGLQPFHDFASGPDWWSTDDYKAVIAQLAKLKMNFIGLHSTYFA